MANNTTRIQLLSLPQAVPGTTSIGYLDVAEEVVVPVNYSAADIKEPGKRSGAFSRTIKLPGTKNNHNLLGQLYDINIVQGTFDINKLQPCHLLQNNVPVVQNAYMQLVRVNKKQMGPMEDEWVEYEVVVKDEVSDFFTKLGAAELGDLDFSAFDHSASAQSITDSFDNTWVDGYKYLGPWVDNPQTGSPWFTLNDWKPAIYAKQYWEKIHNEAGFVYEWTTQADPFVQFDRLVIPYNGDDAKLNQGVNNANAVLAEGPAQTFNIGPVLNIWNVTPQAIPLKFPTEIQDALNLYDPLNSVYIPNSPVAAPNSLEFTFNIDFDFIINNPTAGSIIQSGPNMRMRPEILIVNQTNGVVLETVPLASYTPGYPPGPVPATVPETLSAGANTVISQTQLQLTTSISNISAGTPIGFRLRVGVDPTGATVSYITTPPNAAFTTFTPIINIYNPIELSIKFNSETIVYNQPILINDYIPSQVKQSDFIKSICMMYNLIIDQDPNDTRKLIYRHRDDYYDSGTLRDWTYKLDRETPQTLSFLPELFKKRMILTYQDDDDVYNKAYLDTTKETYGMQEVVFENSYIKDIDRREIIFSPTPMRPIQQLGVIAPLIPGQNPSTGLRILIDNGGIPCHPYTIQNYVGFDVPVTDWPFLSHLNADYNPTFDINFGVCEYYFYDIQQYTNNNLYNLFWKRTMAQMNSGKMLTALFALTPLDIQQMKMNDKIRIDNSYWNINKVIDYDANSNSLTKVELISIDDNLQLPRFGKQSQVVAPWAPSSTQDSTTPVRPTKPVLDAATTQIKKSNLASSVINTDAPVDMYGKRNVLGPDFAGVVVASDIRADLPGFYTQNWALNSGGIEIVGTTIIDAGADVAIPPDKTDPIDIIDGGLDITRPFSGIPRTLTTRTWIDGGLDRV